MKQEIEIPDGYEAKIEGNNVILVPKEIEDERIKNLIYCIVRDRREVGEMLKANGCPVKKALSWIAKHEEQKPRSTEETELNSLAFLEQLGYTCIPPGAEQKPIFKEGDKVIWQGEEFNILDVNEDSYNVGGYILPFYRQKELSLVEQKPAEWSEEDEQFLLVCKNALQKYQSSDKWDAAIIYNWLEKRLKSLRPQPHWKPSDAQMQALELVLGYHAFASPKTKGHINSLYDDLKRL